MIAAHLDGTPGQAPLEEGFHYDGAQNLIARIRSKLPGVERQDLRQQAGRVVQRGRDRYRYDKLGRLVEKTVHVDGFRPQHWRYRWDGEDRLAECVTPQGERWRYAYDGLGRRVRKFKVIAGGAAATPVPPAGQDLDTSVLRASAPERIIAPGRGPSGGGGATAVVGEEYLWAGDQLIEAAPIYADGTVAYDRAVRWAYAPGAVTPLAQQRGDRLWYVVTDQVGTPRELLDEAGELAWSNSPRLWGQQRLWRHLTAANDDAVDCPLRFPGQYYDQESGLHYNRHRYYDPETAQYLTPDPLGLEGGIRPQGYVKNPNAWVDPSGLAGCPYAGVREASAYLQAQGVPRHVRKQVLESFDIQTIKVRQAGPSEYGLRYYDNVNAFAKGRYLFESFPASRESLALDPQWNAMTNIAQWKIRSGATLFEGAAAPQGPGLPGGQTQKFIPNLDDLLVSGP